MGVELQLYSSSILSLTYFTSKFLYGQLYQYEVGFIVFINIYIYLLLKLGKKSLFIIFYITLFISLLSIAIISKHNEFINTVSIETKYLMDAVKHQTSLFKERLFIQVSSKNLQEQEYLLHNCLYNIINLSSIISLDYNNIQSINTDTIIEQILNVFPSTERRIVLTFITNFEFGYNF